ncbi:hypothetical protein CEUSTIGMA_g4227.t1 [Chlamydomonas eustigma]|uniref:histidine kinase n=1 Tax=Chlamydomonas eustigma TaxID=1157962 RepID=A0A250X121_9CHLO|nr:hypothetical protein CEUSTIGMA_g4227.t1 [Chlamydomonas eustigma]|eukprot:GAX76781.1 hypothetical protein CEUSTIGMA_g4227.t1 [Chlamydomonas eustigma]
MVAFATAFTLNFATLVFERDSGKMQLALFACYINFLACFNDWLGWQGVSPVLRDIWGGGLLIMRFLMWLHTTPAMVYLLSILSDFDRQRVLYAIMADVLMLAFGLGAQLAPNVPFAVVCFIISTGMFAYVVHEMWCMFSGSLREIRSANSRHSLQVLRCLAVGLWFSFPIIFVAVKAGLTSLYVEEWLWTLGDFMGKVMFSSSLLYGNFLTIEQRRLIAMRIVEESNRIQVIKELKDLVEQKERFMSSVSHELRTPLNGIIGLSDGLIIGSCGPLSESALKTVATIKTSGSRLLTLVNDILDAASMRLGKLVVKQEKVSVKRAVEDVLELCQPLAKRGVHLVNNVSESLPAALGDTGRIIQIFHNLIGNSCKFTHSGHIYISATSKGEEIEVSVSDSGIGIQEERFQKIFEAFEQVDMSTTRKYGGTGLGLNLVKQLVEAHNGTIWVNSKMGVGTTFTFTLKTWNSFNREKPVKSAEEVASDKDDASQSGEKVHFPRRVRSFVSDGGLPGSDNEGVAKASNLRKGGLAVSSGNLQALIDKHRVSAGSGALHSPRNADTSSSPWLGGENVFKSYNAKEVQLFGIESIKGSSSSPLRVLSVDDDPVNQMVVQNLLEPEGYEILQAMDGQEALDLLKSEDRLPDVILLDVMMPGMSGYDVCRKIQELYPLNCLPIIMVSAKSKEENIVEGLEAGSNDYLVKPFGRKEILARIKAHLRFRNAVYLMGQLSASSYLREQDALKVGSTAGDCAGVESLLLEDAKSIPFSLPNDLKTDVEHGKSPTMKMFEKATLVVASIVNLDKLADILTPSELVSLLTGLNRQVDKLLHDIEDAYVLPGSEGHIMVATGLSGSRDQVQDAVSFSSDLLSWLEDEGPQSLNPSGTDIRIQLSVGIHTCAAQGAVIGVNRPGLHLLGNLVYDSSRLVAICPPSCILVSSNVYGIIDEPAMFCKTDVLHGLGPTYLLKDGSWEAGAKIAPELLSRYNAEKPYGPVNSSARRLWPVQLAILMLMEYDPGLLIGLLNKSSRVRSLPPISIKLGQGAQARAGYFGSHTSDALLGTDPEIICGDDGDNDQSKGAPLALISQLQHEKDVLEKQLEEVSEECNRLQDLVDSLQSCMDEKQLAQTPHTSHCSAGDTEREGLSEATAHHATEGKGVDNDAAVVVGLSTILEVSESEHKSEPSAVHQQLQERVDELEEKLAIAEVVEQQLEAAEELLLTLQKEKLALAEELRSCHQLLASLQQHDSPSASGHHRIIEDSHLEFPKLSEGIASTSIFYLRPLSRSRSVGKASLGGSLPPSRHSSAVFSHSRSQHSQSLVVADTSYTLPLVDSRDDQTMSRMSSLLHDAGLSHLINRFSAEDITPEMLPYLDDEVLKDLGVSSMGARMKLKSLGSLVNDMGDQSEEL